MAQQMTSEGYKTTLPLASIRCPHAAGYHNTKRLVVDISAEIVS